MYRDVPMSRSGDSDPYVQGRAYVDIRDPYVQGRAYVDIRRPDPCNINRFNVIFPLLQELHQWTALLKLVKVIVMLVANSIKWPLSWWTRDVPLTKDLSFLGCRCMDPYGPPYSRRRHAAHTIHQWTTIWQPSKP